MECLFLAEWQLYYWVGQCGFIDSQQAAGDCLSRPQPHQSGSQLQTQNKALPALDHTDRCDVGQVCSLSTFLYKTEHNNAFKFYSWKLFQI